MEHCIHQDITHYYNLNIKSRKLRPEHEHNVSYERNEKVFVKYCTAWVECAPSV